MRFFRSCRYSQVNADDRPAWIGHRRFLQLATVACLVELATFFVLPKRDDSFASSNVEKLESSPAIEALLRQDVWKGHDIIALLDAPKCADAIRRAKQRQPPNVALCPLCTRGTLGNSTVQYLKVAKAGSSAMIQLLTHEPQAFNDLARHLCQGQPQNDFRFSLVRNPLERVVSAYKEVDTNQWKHSPNVTYRKQHIEPSRILQFLDDFFSGRMESWDCGSPHHMFSAAITLDAARSMNRLPQLLGRLENMTDFTAALNSMVGSNMTAPAATYVRGASKIVPNIYEASDVIYSLFEEDFVCFGYSFEPNASVQPSSSWRTKYQKNYRKKVTAPDCTTHYILEPSP